MLLLTDVEVDGLQYWAEVYQPYIPALPCKMPPCVPKDRRPVKEERGRISHLSHSCNDTCLPPSIRCPEHVGALENGGKNDSRDVLAKASCVVGRAGTYDCRTATSLRLRDSD